MPAEWMTDPEDHDFDAAASYLALLVSPSTAAKLVKALRKEDRLGHAAARDILRASGSALLPPEDPEVERDLRKVRAGKKLSPVLLVRGEPLWIADGYHRVCVSCHLDPLTPVPYRMVDRN